MKFVARILFLFVLAGAAARVNSAQVLIIADEFPAMATLADKLRSEEKIESLVIAQSNMPASLEPFSVVVVYVHRGLSNDVETNCIHYAESGGKLVLLHHSISTGKRKNQYWFPFLGVTLPEGDFDKGAYKYVEPATWSIVNLAPGNFITTHRVNYPQTISYRSTNLPALPAELPGFTLTDDEVYLNQALSGPRTLLLGLKYTDAKSGATYMQDTAGWMKPAGKGWVVYLAPGHRELDFEDPVYSRIVINSIICQPK